MTTAQYFRNNSEQKFNYVGTIYGTDEYEMTGEQIADMLQLFGETSEMIDHPAHGGRDGFYQQSGNIHYSGNLVEECVFVALN
jgi:hypothetical protein